MIPRDELKALVDNELSPARRAEVLKAVQADPELQAQVIELRGWLRDVGQTQNCKPGSFYGWPFQP